jgi:carnitine-CoA ligase
MSIEMTLPILISEKAKSQPDFVVLTFENNGAEETRSYSQLWNNALRIALSLRERGIKSGDRFAILMQNHPEFVESMIAAGILGAVTVPIDPRTKGEKLAYMLRDSGSVGIICGDYSLADVQDALHNAKSVKWVFAVGNTVSPTDAELHIVKFDQIYSLPVIDIPITADKLSDLMQIMYTSGTTGDPKGIYIPHGRFDAVAKAGELVFGYRTSDRLYTGLSLTHGNAQFVTLAPALKMGIPAFISRKFTKTRLWDVIRKYRCTTFSLLGGMATAIYSEPFKPSDSDNTVRFVVSAGMPKVIWNAFVDRFKLQIFEFYGAMEGGMTINPPGEGPAGSCGRVAPGLIVKVVNDEGKPVPPNKPGELWFRPADGTAAVVHYHNNPEASSLKTMGGWLRTGDVATMDEAGWIFFQHRLGGEIRRNGDFINPAYLEKAIAEHPDVSDVAVFGVAAKNGAPGEMDVAIAVIPVSKAEFNPESVFSWCREKVELNMVPTYLMVVDELPKTASEKIQPRFLKQMFEGGDFQIHTAMTVIL